MFNKDYLTRQAEIIPAEKQGRSITIIGAGAIGSFTALALAKMGYLNLTVYDHDDIDTENMNCQFYKPADIGRAKVDALIGMINEFTGVMINGEIRKITPSDYLRSDIIISAVDSMAVRACLLEVTDSTYLIDPRMAAEYASLEVVDRRKPEQLDNYAKTLYTDGEAAHERCTAKSTMYTVMLIAGQIAKVVKDVTLEEDYIKTFNWDIKHNRLTSFAASGAPLQ